MNPLSFFGYAIMLSIASVVALIARRWIRSAWYAGKALRVLSRERRTGETLYDTAEALSGDAHNWRGMTISHHRAEDRTFKEDQKTEKVTAPDGFVLTEDWNLAVVPQPPPQNESGPALWPMIISELGNSEVDRLITTDMLARHEFGVAKYGVPLVASNGRDHLADAYQEALDMVVYLRAAFDAQASATHVEYEVMRSGAICGPKKNLGCSRLHRLYVDALDSAKEIRELIHERDGR